MSYNSRHRSISEGGICFHGTDFPITVAQEALTHHEAHRKTYNDWIFNDDTPIIPDTNFLLNMYMVTASQRTQVIKFLEANRNRIYIPHQVQREFMRHRMPFIDEYKNKLTVIASKFREKVKLLTRDFVQLDNDLEKLVHESEVIGGLPNTMEVIDTLKKFHSDTPLFADKTEEHAQLCQSLLERFNAEYASIYSSVNLEYQDNVLEAVSHMHILPELSDKEIDFTKELYQQLSERYTADCDKHAKYLKFPGCGDKPKEGMDEGEPWADLVVYHEILSFMVKEQKNVIFLTNDVSKNDWLQKDSKQPFSHYIIDVYHNTQHSLYIIHAADFIPTYNSQQSNTDEGSVDAATPAAASSPTPVEQTQSDTYSPFMSISEETFLQELQNYAQWAQQFADDYVNEQFFIKFVLGRKGYDYSTSFDVKDALLGRGAIERYEHIVDGRTINCIKPIIVETPDTQTQFNLQ